MRDVPIAVLLSFPTPNYVNPQTQGTSLIVVNAIFAGLVTTAVALRLYTRLFIKQWLGLDDIYITIAWLFTIGLNFVVILANARYYWDRHVWDIPIDKLAGVGKIAMAAKVMFVMASFCTRQSLLSFYLRLTSDTGLSKYKWVMHGAVVFNVALLITFLPLCIFLCTPISAYWDYPSTGHCIDEGKVTLAVGVINCFADLLITSLPIPMVMKLRMPFRQRFGVAVLLGLGFIVTIAGIIRTYFIWKSLIESYDETWFAYPLWICAAVEIDLAVLCACAPTLRPLLIKLTKPLISSLVSKYSKDSRTGYASNEMGVLSSDVTGPTLRDKSGSNTVTEQDLERLDSIVDTEERTLTSMPERGSSNKSWKRDSNGKYGTPKSPTRLTIMESHSFEIRHENRKPTTDRTSQDTYLPLDDSAIALRNQWMGLSQSPPGPSFGHRHHISASSSLLRIPGVLPEVAKPLPQLLPDEAFTNLNVKLGRKQGKGFNADTFFISEPSSSGERTPASKKSVEWPLRPMSPDKPKHEEEPWDFERNPFRDTDSVATSDTLGRPTTSLGISDASGSYSLAWEELQAHKMAANVDRSNSLQERSKVYARMLR